MYQALEYSRLSKKDLVPPGCLKTGDRVLSDTNTDNSQCTPVEIYLYSDRSECTVFDGPNQIGNLACLHNKV